MFDVGCSAFGVFFCRLDEDPSRVLRWARHLGHSRLAQTKLDAEIIAFSADIGQEEELDGLTEKALRTGAAKCIIEDLREEFAREILSSRCFRRVRFTRDNIFSGRALPVRSLPSTWSKLRVQNQPRRLRM